MHCERMVSLEVDYVQDRPCFPLSLSSKPNSHCVTWAATTALSPCASLLLYSSDIDMYNNARSARYRSFLTLPLPLLSSVAIISCDDYWPTTLEYAMYIYDVRVQSRHFWRGDRSRSAYLNFTQIYFYELQVIIIFSQTLNLPHAYLERSKAAATPVWRRSFEIHLVCNRKIY